jgi:carboxylesterase type B
MISYRLIFIIYYFKFIVFVICQNQDNDLPINSDDTNITLPVESLSSSNPTTLAQLLFNNVNKQQQQQQRQELSDETHLVKKIDKTNNFIAQQSNSGASSSSNSNSQEKKAKPNVIDEELMVRVKNGVVRGKPVYLDYHLPANQKKSTKYKKRVNAWLGIPYAEKPIKENRFKRPIPAKSWSGIYNATRLQNTCYQLRDDIFPGFWGTELWNPNTEVSEDCLYLNVWTPHPKPKNSAVMVWIYGGSFLSGTSTLKIYDPRIIVGETDMIFVSLNYRVSILGFLYMDHENAPGNMGLLDQNMALNWVYNNIQFFGGDNTKITIFGESAGSASVSLHLLSPLSAPFFKSAIMQSGSSMAEWATLDSSIALKRNREYLENLNCKGSTAEMIECARKIHPKHFLEKSDEYFYTRADASIMQFPYLPVVDNYFLPEEPIVLLNKGKFKKCPIMLGVNKDEANWFYIYQFADYRNLTVLPPINYEMHKKILANLFTFYPQFPSRATKPVIDAILYKYTPWDNVHNIKRNIEMLDDAPADYHFICPALDFAGTFATNQQDVFFYYFTQRATTHLWPDWFGVLHADEIQFVFGEPLYPQANFTEEEKVFTRKLLKYWSNFARYDNPNGYQVEIKNEHVISLDKKEPEKLNLTTLTLKQYIEPWPKYQVLFDSESNNQKAHLVLNAAQVEVGYNLRSDYCSFWNSYLPNLILNQRKLKFFIFILE